MAGVAAGLALSGKIVSQGTPLPIFQLCAALEHIRNDICYHSLDVRIVSVGGGLAVRSAAGYTHHEYRGFGNHVRVAEDDCAVPANLSKLNLQSGR